jgi:hypothetical protein
MTSGNKPRNPRSTSDADLATILGDEVNALRLEAVAVLCQKNSERYDDENFNIREASLGACGSPTDALRNLIAHLPNHDTQAILECYRQAVQAGVPEDVLLTNEHIAICTALDYYRSELVLEGDESDFSPVGNAEYRSIMSHALKHIEDGRFVVSLYVDRGMRTYQEIIDFIPTLKAASHQALTEGAL